MTPRIQFDLFRTKLTFPLQLTLGWKPTKRETIIRTILKERPTLVTKQGPAWHIGNVDLIDRHGGYFAFGRTTSKLHQQFDEKTKNFIDEPAQESPYTHVIFDSKIGLLAIARKSTLAPTTQGIARAIERVFSQSDIIQRNGIDVSISPIHDPTDFIEAIRSAYAVFKFAWTFSRPNPLDVDRYFQAPVEKMLELADGDSGKTTVRGKDLNHETIAEVSRSVAATGNDATARIMETRRSETKTVHLSGSPVQLSIAESGFRPEDALPLCRDKYDQVRSNE